MFLADGLGEVDWRNVGMCWRVDENPAGHGRPRQSESILKMSARRQTGKRVLQGPE
jgi:hypothetical protein